MKKPLVSLLMPVLNEKEHLPMAVGVLSAIAKYPFELIVIYDTKNDNTIPVAKSLQKRFPEVKLHHNKYGKGLKNALDAGMEISQGKYIAVVHADDAATFQGINKAIKLLIKGCDFVSGTRYAHGGVRIGGSRSGRIFSKVCNKAFHLLLGGFTDPTTGFKAFKKTVYPKIAPTSQVGGGLFFEMGIKARHKNLKLGEIPIVSIDRLYGGKSTFESRKWMPEYIRLFTWGGKQLMGKKKPRIKLIPN